MKNIFKIVMVIIGTLIGAGFASGREIYIFFFRYGKDGLIGLIISGILTGIIIFFTLEKSIRYNSENYNELLIKINPKYQKFNFFIKNIVTTFLLITFYIMVAGFSAYMKQNYNINIFISSSIIAFFCYFIFRKNVEGILKLNTFIIPIVLILILYIGIISFPDNMQNMWINNANSSDNCFIFSILYTSYNSIVLIPMLVALKNFINNKKNIFFIAFFSVLLIILLAFSIYCVLLKENINFNDIEMPVIEIISNYGSIFKLLYGGVIILSIITSAISSGYSFLENINKKNYNIKLGILCFSSIIISNIGFSNLVNTIYPIFGLLGILQFFFILKNNTDRLEKKAKN